MDTIKTTSTDRQDNERLSKGISVVINTYNADVLLEECLSAVKDFDEIVICDMYSTDMTLEIASKYKAKIVMFEYVGIVEPAREFAIRAASHEWTLVVDADEIVTPELRKYLYEFIDNNDNIEGLSLTFKNFFMGRYISSLYPNHQLRFFRTAKTHWSNSTIFSCPVVDGAVKKIAPSRHELAILHYADNSIRTRVHKINLYTDKEQLRYQDKKFSFFKLWVKSWWRFFRLFVIKGGFRDGMPGYIYAKLDEAHKFISIAKKIESQYEEHQHPNLNR